MQFNRGFSVVGIAIFLACFQNPAAFPQSAIDGNVLLENCQAYVRVLDNPKSISDEDAINGADCSGYVTGVVDDHLRWQADDKSPADSARFFCLPYGVNPNEGIRVIAKWLEENPNRLHESAAGLVIDALRASFPCRR